MHKFYVHSSDAILHHPDYTHVDTVAVYDRELLTQFLLGVKFRGDPEACRVADRAVKMFLEFWDNGDDRVSITVNGLTMAVYPVKYVESEKHLISLGPRPANPYQDILHSAARLSRCMERNGGDCVKQYKELQSLLTQYPELPVFKEKA